MKTIKPLGSMVLVRPVLAADKVRGGLVLPDDVKQDRPDTGTVFAVGPQVKRVKKGEQVIINRYAADEVTMDEGGKDSRFLLLDESEIYATFK